MTSSSQYSHLIPDDQPYWKLPELQASLYLGDSLHLLATVPDKSVDCIWTDPPYNLSNDGITCVGGKMVPVNKGEWDRSRGLEGDYQFNLAWTAECFRILKETGSIWVTGTMHAHPSIGMALQQNGFRLLNDIIWEKNNPPPNLGRRTFTHSTELLFWASKARRGYKFNYELMKEENGGKQMKTVWKFGIATQKEKKEGKHPTQKPVALIERCLRAATDPGDTVLDPFTGSSSTGIAALQLGCSFVGFDTSEEYLELSQRRLSALSKLLPPPTSASLQILGLLVFYQIQTRWHRLWNEPKQLPNWNNYDGRILSLLPGS